MINSSTTTPSPNASTDDSSSDHHQLMTMQEHNMMPMYMHSSSSSSSSSFVTQAMAMNTALPVFEHELNMSGNSNGSYFNNIEPTTYMPQYGMDGHNDGHGMYGNHGGLLFGVCNNINLGFVTPLESTIGSEERDEIKNCFIDRDTYNYNNNNHHPFNDTSKVMINNHCNNSVKVEKTAGFETCCWQGEDDLKVGDWDLDELMKDASSFPLLDFQLE